MGFDKSRMKDIDDEGSDVLGSIHHCMEAVYGVAATDVQKLLDEAIESTGVDQVDIRHRPRLLSGNGACFISSELAEYLNGKNGPHAR